MLKYKRIVNCSDVCTRLKTMKFYSRLIKLTQGANVISIRVTNVKDLVLKLTNLRTTYGWFKPFIPRIKNWRVHAILVKKQVKGLPELRQRTRVRGPLLESPSVDRWKSCPSSDPRTVWKERTRLWSTLKFVFCLVLFFILDIETLKYKLKRVITQPFLSNALFDEL